ncbi:MAG: hypothetical protein HRT41_11005 [Campylobacteraceae bacterium]|nr:hypothetical protein [Campylobacteraceae bacterium]
MTIDEKAFNNSTYTFLSSDQYANNFDNNEVFEILKIFNINKSKDKLLESDDNNYLLLISYINKLFYFNEDIPKEIQDVLKYNGKFKDILHSYVKKKTDALMSNEGITFFREVTLIINLLSMGKNYNIFTSYDTYNFDNLGTLFRDYESILSEEIENKASFLGTFLCYKQLIFVLQKLCIINSTDLSRKKTIQPILNLITESINILKYTVNLSKENLSSLNNVLGMLLYYFAHLPYISTKNKSIEYIIDEYYLNLEKQVDGYTISKECDFDERDEKEEFIIFKSNASFLLLVLLQKLDSRYDDIDYFETDNFKRCIRLYNKKFSLLLKEELHDDEESFKNKLLDNFIYKYHVKSHEKVINNHKDLIDNFIKSDNKYIIQNLEIVHDILLFSNHIEDYKYLNIAEILIESPLIKNDYYEFFKLKTIDIIINYFIHSPSKENIDELINRTFTYIEKQKKTSHLLSIYSKIYIDLVTYLSAKTNISSINKAKDIYTIFINMNGYEILENEYVYANRILLLNFASFHAKELKLEDAHLTDDILLNLGKSYIDKCIQFDSVKHKAMIASELSSITQSVIFDNSITKEDIEKNLSSLISEELFYGLSSVRIVGLNNKSSDILDKGYKTFELPLLHKYSIEFIFPAVYESAFSQLLKNNKQFILTNINNIIANLEAKNFNQSETDKLKNKQNLIDDLGAYEYETPALIDIYVASLPLVIKEYGFKAKDKYLAVLKERIQEIVKDSTIYKIDDFTLSILFPKLIDFSEILNRLFSLKVENNEKNIDLDFTIAITSSNKESLLYNSRLTLSQAIKKEKPYLINIEKGILL